MKNNPFPYLNKTAERALLLSLLLVTYIKTATAQTTKTVGTSGDYINLKTAFDSINAGTITGNIILKIIGNTSEPSVATLNGNGTGSANYTSILIKPDSSLTPVISGNVPSTGLIQFNGATNITIDGSNKADTSRDLTIINSNASGHVILFQNGASTNIIKNAILKGNGSAGQGVVTFSTTSSPGNNYNIIQNNEITKGSGTVSYAIFNNGTPTNALTSNKGDTIRGNLIHDFAQSGIFDNGGSTGAVYSDNEIYNTSAVATSVSGFKTSSQSINGFSFIRNYIHDLTGNQVSAPDGCGIYLGDVSPSTTCLIANNRIVLSSANSNNTFFGIYDAPTVNTLPFEILYNTIVVTGTGTLGGNANSAPYARTRNSTTKLVNNILVNTRTGGTGFHSVIFLVTIGLISNLTSDYNDLYNPNVSSSSDILNNNQTLQSLSTWKAFSKDAHSVSIKPEFVNSYSDLHISGTNCMLDGKGTPITTSAGFAFSVNDDFENDIRDDSIPDFGADEFTAASLPSPVLTLLNDTIYSTSASSYQWYRNGLALSGATDSFYVITGDGSYNVLINDSNGCGSFGNIILITPTNDIAKDELVIYPNPAKNELWVVSNGLWTNKEIIILELMNILGETVYRSQPLTSMMADPSFGEQNPQLKTNINTSSLPPGIYTLSIHTDEKTENRKIIIEK